MRLLVVEDGFEYTEGLRRLAGRSGPDIELLRAGDLEEARGLLGEAGPEAVLLDVVFDRTPEGKLAGDLASLVARFGGDRRRAVRELQESQGFHLLDALAPDLPAGTRVLIAHDFSGEPGRLEALRERVPGLLALPEGAPLSKVLELLVGGS